METVFSLLSDSGHFNWYVWVVLPIVIFLARVADVTLGTLRIIFTSRGRRTLAPLFGFVEVLIWIVATSQLVKSTEGFLPFIGYAAGFATGNFLGMWIEDKMAMGTLVLRIILSNKGDTLASNMHAAGYGVTMVDGQGSHGPVKLLYMIIDRKDLANATDIIHATCPGAFFSIEEIRSYEKGIFPMNHQSRFGAVRHRKGK